MKVTIIFNDPERSRKVFDDVVNLQVRKYNNKICFNYLTELDDSFIYSVPESDIKSYCVW